MKEDAGCVARLGGFALRVDALGGKVREIVPDVLGRNILSEPAVPYVIDGVSGHRFEVAGWDEACPTVAESAGWPELGWAWQTFAQTKQERDCLRTEWRFPGMAFERALAVSERALTASYRLQNAGPDDLPFLWASHALYGVEGLLELEMPGGDLVAGPCCLLSEVEVQIERSGGRARMRDFSDTGLSWKCFVAADGPLELRFADGTLRIETTAPWFGVFLNRGRFGLPCLGIEPTSHPTDYAADAGVLAAGERVEYSWSLRVGA